MTLKDSIRFDGTIAGLKISGRFTIEGLKQPSRFVGGPTTTPLQPFNLIFDGYGGPAVNVNRAGVHAVDLSQETGPNSYADAPSDRFVIFPGQSGYIPYADGSDVLKNNFVLGQTSDGSINFIGTAATTRKALVTARSGGFIFSNVGFYAGETDGINNQNRTFDILNSTTSVDGAIMHRCMFGYGDDHVASTWYGTRNVSWLDCIFARGVDGFQRNYPLLIGGGSERITLARCLLKGRDRAPNVQDTGLIDVTNNVIEYEGAAVAFQGISGKPYPHPDLMTANCTENLFIRDNNGSVSDINFHLKNDVGTGNPNLQVRAFLDNNFRMFRGTDPAASVPALISMYSTSTGTNASNNPADYVVSTRYDSPLFAKHDPQTELFAYVTGNAGPKHRDSITTEIVNETINGVYPRVETTVANYGFYPTPAVKPAIDIWNSGQVDYIDNSIKAEKYGLAPNSDTTQSFTNGGTDAGENPVCDWLAILNQEGIF